MAHDQPAAMRLRLSGRHTCAELVYIVQAGRASLKTSLLFDFLLYWTRLSTPSSMLQDTGTWALLVSAAIGAVVVIVTCIHRHHAKRFVRRLRGPSSPSLLLGEWLLWDSTPPTRVIHDIPQVIWNSGPISKRLVAWSKNGTVSMGLSGDSKDA